MTFGFASLSLDIPTNHPLAEAKMKVFRYVSSIPRHVDLPVDKHVTQCSLIVAAPTKKRAIELFAETGVDCTPYLLNTYGSGDAHPDDVRTATERPGLVFARPLADTSVYLPVMSQDEHDALMEQVRYEQGADDVAAGERDRREQRALEEWENEHDDGMDAAAMQFDLRDEICGYPV